MQQDEGTLAVKPVVAVLYRGRAAWEEAGRQMTGQWGASEYTSDGFPFDMTDYYSAEMGQPLTRRLLSFATLRPPDWLVPFKVEAARLERSLSENGRRTVNIDPGYLDLHKLVLASFKPGPHKIYLGQHVWADMTLFYRKGAFETLPWTFPDFRTGRYNPFLTTVRQAYRSQRRVTKK